MSKVDKYLEILESKSTYFYRRGKRKKGKFTVKSPFVFWSVKRGYERKKWFKDLCKELEKVAEGRESGQTHTIKIFGEPLTKEDARELLNELKRLNKI